MIEEKSALRPHRIEMVFYVHPWSIHLLDENILKPTDSNLLIEVALQSNLSFLCGDLRGKRVGALPLLTNPAQVKMQDLGTTIPLIPAPLVLAANPPLSRETLIQSLMALESCELGCDAVYLLVHVYNAATFKPVFPLVDKFSFLWDGADHPSDELVDCTQALAETESLTQDRWGGFYLTNHWLRETEGGDENRENIQNLLTAHGLN